MATLKHTARRDTQQNNTAGTRNTTGSTVQSQAQSQAQPQAKSATRQTSNNSQGVSYKHSAPSSQAHQSASQPTQQKQQKFSQRSVQQTSKTSQKFYTEPKAVKKESTIQATVQNAPTVQQSAAQQTRNPNTAQGRRNIEANKTTEQKSQERTRWDTIKTIVDTADRNSKITAPSTQIADNVERKSAPQAKYSVKATTGKNKHDEDKSFVRKVTETASDIIRSIPEAIADQKRNDEYLKMSSADLERQLLANGEATAEDIAEAKRLYALRNQSYDFRTQGHAGERKAAMWLTGRDTPYDDNGWFQYLPKRSDENLIHRTGNAVAAGANQWQSGLAGLRTAIAEGLGEENSNRFLQETDFQKQLLENHFGRTPQEMYDRLVMSGTNNALNAAEGAVLNSALGLGMGAPLARALSLGTMAANVYGGSYGDVRTGRMGEEYQNDIDAARRYALANAALETGTELVIPDGMIPGADIPTLGNFMGEFAEEGLGGLLEPLTNAALEGDITSKEFWDRANQIYAEQGLEGTLQNALQSGIEGGLGGLGGAFVAHPVQTIQQARSDVNAIRAERGARASLEAFNNHLAEAKTVRDNSDMGVFSETVNNDIETRAQELRDYLKTGALKSSIRRNVKTAQEINRRLAEYSAERTGAKVDDMKSMLEISNRLGTPFEFTDGKINGHDAVYDNGRILINSKASNMYDTLFAHEVGHAAEGSADYDRYCNELDRLVEAGLIDDTDATGNERYANLTENIIKKGAKSLRDIANYNPSTIRYLFDQGKAFISGDKTNAALNRTMRKLNLAISQAQYNSNARTEYKEQPNVKTFGLSQDDIMLIAQAIEDRGDGKVTSDVYHALVDEFGYDELSGASLNDVANLYRVARGQAPVEEQVRETKRLPEQKEKPKKKVKAKKTLSQDDYDVIQTVVSNNGGKVDYNVINDLIENYGYKALENMSVSDLQKRYDDRVAEDEQSLAEKRANAPERIKKLLATKGRLHKGYRYGMTSDEVVMLADAIEMFNADESVADGTKAAMDFLNGHNEGEEHFEILDYLTPQEVWEFVQKNEKKARGSVGRKEQFINDVFPEYSESGLSRKAGMAPESLLVEKSGVISGQTVNKYYQSLQDDIDYLRKRMPAGKTKDVIEKLEGKIAELTAKRRNAVASKLTETYSKKRGKDSDYYIRERTSEAATLKDEIDKYTTALENAKKVQSLEEELNDILNNGSKSKVFKENGLTPIKKVELKRELKSLGYENGLIDESYTRWGDAVEQVMDLEQDESLTPEERRRKSLEILAKKDSDEIDPDYQRDIAEAKEKKKSAKSSNKKKTATEQETFNKTVMDAEQKPTPVNEQSVEAPSTEQTAATEETPAGAPVEQPAEPTAKEEQTPAAQEQEAFDKTVMGEEESAPKKKTRKKKTGKQAKTTAEESSKEETPVVPAEQSAEPTVTEEQTQEQPQEQPAATETSEETTDVVERARRAFGEERSADNLAKYYEELGISEKTAAKMAKRIRDNGDISSVEQTAAREMTQANREEYPEVVDARDALSTINEALLNPSAENTQTQQDEPSPSDLAEKLQESVEEDTKEPASEATKKMAEDVSESINEFTEEEFEQMFREGGSTSALSTLYSSSGAKVESANALAELIISTGRAKKNQAYATVRDEILKAQKERAEARGEDPNSITKEDVEALMGRIKSVYSDSKARGKQIAREEAKLQRQAEREANKLETPKNGINTKKSTVTESEQDIAVEDKDLDRVYRAAEEIAEKPFTKTEKEDIKAVDKKVKEKRAKQQEQAKAQEEKVLDDIENGKNFEQAQQQNEEAPNEQASEGPAQDTTSQAQSEQTSQQEQAKTNESAKEGTTSNENQKKAYSETEHEIHESETGNRNYAFEHSKHKSAERLLKSRNISVTIKELIKESYRKKPVVKDAIVKANAKKWLAEGGLENAVQYAFAYNTTDARMTEEGMAYLEETIDSLNRITKTLGKEMKRFEKVFKDNDIETTEKGFLQNGKEVKSFVAKDGTEYDFDTWDALKTEQYERSQQSATVVETVLNAASEAGRIMRMMRFLHDNPVTAKSYLDKTIEKLNRMYEKDLGKKKVTLSQELADEYVAAESDEKRQEVMEKIEREVADQLPRRLGDMVRQWRMTAMLLNPRTHIRNYASNVLTKGLFRVNDVVQTGIEQALYKTGVIKESDLSSAVTVSRDMKDAVKWLDSRDHFSEEKSGSGKFSFYEARLAAGAFHNTNPIGKFLNDLSKLNSEFLDKREDKPFVVSRAQRKLAEMLSAQGYKVEKTTSGEYKITKNNEPIDSAVLKAMEETALQDAQESTYHDFNKTAQMLEDFKRGFPALGPALDIIVPFTKTPANILRRSREFSPIGLAKTLLIDSVKVKKGTLSASSYVTRLSRGLTGTGMFVVGMLMANLGLLSKPDDDDEEERVSYYNENIFGKQDFALHIGDRYYSINWAMPSTAPLIMGAAMSDTFSKHGKNALDEVGGSKFKSVARDVANAINPILEESYLGSLSDFVKDMAQGINYGGEWLPAGGLGLLERAGTSVAENFVGQLFPTIGGAINRTIDSTKRTTSGNTTLERMKNKALMNTPGLSRYLEPAVDEKGQQIENIGAVFGNNPAGRIIYNFMTPMTITEDTHDKLDSELMNVGRVALPRNQTGSGGLKGQIYADLEKKGMTIGDITSKEYTQVKKTYYGNYREYAEAYNELAEYNNLGTHARDDVYKKLEQLALAEAKGVYYSRIGDVDELYTEEQKAALVLKDLGVSPAQFYLMKDCGLTGNRRALYVMDELEALGVADDVEQAILNQKCFPSAFGLTDSILVKTPDEREYAREKYLVEDKYESLESKVAAYRAMSNEEYEKKKKDDSEEKVQESWESLFEKYDKKYGTHYADAFAELSGKENTGTGSKGKGKGAKGSKGSSGGRKKSSTKTTKEKTASTKNSGSGRRGRRSGGGGGGGSSVDADTLALFERFMKYANGALKSPSKSTSSIKASVSTSSADSALFDRIVNSSKSDVEKLKRELGLK